MTGSAMAEGVGVVETVSAALYTVRWKAQSLWDMETRHGAIGPTLNESVRFMVASCVVKGRTILAPEEDREHRQQQQSLGEARPDRLRAASRSHGGVQRREDLQRDSRARG